MWVKVDYAMEILTLGEKIKRRRKELEMTLKDLAGDRITQGQISLVESGRSNPSMDLLEYLANSLQTSVEYLMESEETQAEKICVYYEQMAETYVLNSDYISAEKYIENDTRIIDAEGRMVMPGLIDEQADPLSADNYNGRPRGIAQH